MAQMLLMSNRQWSMEIGAMFRVLHVEDNPIYRMVFKDQFNQYFPTLIFDEATSGDEALEKIRAAPPQAIFMDLRLLGMNGLDLTQKIKKLFPNIHIAILTGYDSPEYRETAFQRGAERFFDKESLQWDELVAFVKSIGLEGNV
jgi:CheY-like chemotaxis protein